MTRILREETKNKKADVRIFFEEFKDHWEKEHKIGLFAQD